MAEQGPEFKPRHHQKKKNGAGGRSRSPGFCWDLSGWRLGVLRSVWAELGRKEDGGRGGGRQQGGLPGGEAMAAEHYRRELDTWDIGWL